MKLLLTILYYIASSLMFFSLNIPKTLAVSENIIITQLQSGKAEAPSEEFILIYNQSPQELKVTNWCIQYASSNTINVTTNDVNFSKLACIESQASNVELWLPASGTVSFATDQFVDKQNFLLMQMGEQPTFTVDFKFSAGMAGLDRHIRLVSDSGQEIDRLGWGAAVRPEGTAFSSMVSGELIGRSFTTPTPDTDNNSVDFSTVTLWNPLELSLEEVVVDACANIGGLQEVIPEGYLDDGTGNCYFDVCPNLDGLQAELAESYYIDEDGDCLPLPLEDRVLFITELLPNAPSVDTGKEFIELYNPHPESINLIGYKLQVGPSYAKEYVFKAGQIYPGQYLSFSDIFTGIVLPNTTGVQIRLIAPAGNTVSDSAAYSNAKDDVSWALIEDVWVYTNQITPGSANKPYLEPAVDEVEGATSVFAPCAAGKYRNPETNRCRTIETAVSQLVPCDEDEYRNPETNRCRKLAASGSGLVPCGEGQERNPATNRCRKISALGVSSESELADVQDLAVENTAGQFNWPIIMAVLGGTVAYMIYEWRKELRQKLYLSKRT